MSAYWVDIAAVSFFVVEWLIYGITLEHTADVLWTYSSPELFDLLVLRRGWSLRQYGAFVAQGIIAALL